MAMEKYANSNHFLFPFPKKSNGDKLPIFIKNIISITSYEEFIKFPSSLNISNWLERSAQKAYLNFIIDVLMHIVKQIYELLTNLSSF